MVFLSIAGTSAASAASNSITATTVPQAPTIGTATCATGQAYTGSANISVPFTAGATGDLQDPDTLVYCYLIKGSIDILELTEWSVTETTVEGMLAAAQEINPEATLENGFIGFPLTEANI